MILLRIQKSQRAEIFFQNFAGSKSTLKGSTVDLSVLDTVFETDGNTLNFRCEKLNPNKLIIGHSQLNNCFISLTFYDLFVLVKYYVICIKK